MLAYLKASIFRGCLHYVTEMGVYIYNIIYIIAIYILLMLGLYNYTRIYIVKYRQNIALCIIYIDGHFSVAREGTSISS